ncbi:MAG: helix-turn-helix domain-containing protein [Cyanobacteria bacterium P01_H01_bin.105]
MSRAAAAEVRRAEVVSATMSLIAAEGPEALSMRKIANHAGCTIGLLNHWFLNKDDLIEAVLDAASSAAVLRVKVAMTKPDVKLKDIVLDFLSLDSKRQEELRISKWGFSHISSKRYMPL